MQEHDVNIDFIDFSRQVKVENQLWCKWHSQPSPLTSSNVKALSEVHTLKAMPQGLL